MHFLPHGCTHINDVLFLTTAYENKKDDKKDAQGNLTKDK